MKMRTSEIEKPCMDCERSSLSFLCYTCNKHSGSTRNLRNYDHLLFTTASFQRARRPCYDDEKKEKE